MTSGERDDFTPDQYPRAQLHLRAEASKHVAEHLEWVEDERRGGPLDDEMIALLIDVSAAVLAVGLPLRLRQRDMPESGVMLDERPLTRPAGRPQLLASWTDRHLAIRDYGVWQRSAGVMAQALADLLRAQGFEVTTGADVVDLIVTRST